MTNPNNAVGTNAAIGGRTSVNAFNDVASVLSRGIITGWVCSAGGGMSVNIGGTADTRDVAIALDNSGNKTTINNISDAPINLTIDAAPATNSRYDVVVAYVDNPAIGNSTDVDNPGACGIIVVKGTASSSPVVPNESAIRTAITSDGASGSTAYYVVLAQITVGAGTTVIASGNITQSAYNSTIASTNILDGSITSSKIGSSAVTSSKISNNSVTTDKLANASVTSSKIDWTTLYFGNYSTTERSTGFTWVDGKTIYKKTVNFGTLPNATTKNVNHNISSISNIINIEGFAKYTTGVTIFIPNVNTYAVGGNVSISVSATQISIDTGNTDRSGASAYITLYYTKTS